MTGRVLTCVTEGCQREVEPLPGRTRCCITCVPEPKGVHLAWCRRRNGDPDPEQPMTCGPCGQAFTVADFFDHACLDALRRRVGQPEKEGS